MVIVIVMGGLPHAPSPSSSEEGEGFPLRAPLSEGRDSLYVAATVVMEGDEGALPTPSSWSLLASRVGCSTRGHGRRRKGVRGEGLPMRHHRHPRKWVRDSPYTVIIVVVGG